MEKRGVERVFFVALLLSAAIKYTNTFHISPALVDFALGGVAGSAGAFITYPIDYVKSQLQTATGRAKYKNGVDAFFQIVAHEGPFSLYRGVGVQIIGLAPEKAIKLSVNDAACTAIRSSTSNGQLPLWGEILAGAMAGFFQVIVTNPLELVKVGLQTSNLTFTEFLQEQVGSLADLYRGAEACLIRDVIFSAILFPLFAHAKAVLSTTCIVDVDGGGSVLVDLIAASIATAPAAFLATPADCVKTRLQNLSDKAIIRPSNLINQDLGNRKNIGYDYGTTNPFIVGLKVAQNEGVEVLFSGSVERMLRSVPQFAVTLTLFDYLKNMAIIDDLL